MKWSWRIGRVAGIGIFMHATFLILLAWFAIIYYQQGGTAQAALTGVLFIVLVFSIVVLHELGHALTARHYGIGTKDIILLPIGGVARLERMPSEPKQELVIAIAGPAVNIVLAFVLYAVMRAVGGTFDQAATIGSVGGLVAQLFAINIVLAVFNMIPAFPMDGGRVLRAFLAMRMNYVRATDIATKVGQGFALLFGLVGLFVLRNPLLVFVALFVYMGAAAEASAVRTTSMIGGVTVRDVMITDVRTLRADEPLARAAELVLAGFQQDFPVLTDGSIVGVLTRHDLVRVLAQRGEAANVSSAMRPPPLIADPEEMVESVIPRLRECQCAIPVVRHGQLLGVLTMENISEYIMIETAVRSGEGDQYKPMVG